MIPHHRPVALRFLGGLLGLALTAVVLFLAFAMLTEYRPAPRQVILSGHSTPLAPRAAGALPFAPSPADTANFAAGTAAGPDTLTLLSWNIGYGGLGDDMDFFYDGGTRMRTSRLRTEHNLVRITRVIDSLDADIVLLQEVDTASRRTYRINELALLREQFPEYHTYFAANYRARFVPLPLTNPTGPVTAGLVLMSRARPREVVRVGYSAQLPWPVRLFELKRCFMAATFTLADGRPLLVANTHNSAYGKGGIRTAQTAELERYLATQYADGIPSIAGGDWNQYPPGYTPTPAELSDPDFRPMPVADSLFGRGWQWAADLSRRSLRYLREPYDPQTTTRTTTDFFVLSPGIELIDVRTVPLGFANSDHNPVVLRVTVR
ncbi:MAG: endonuclease/exonuclease/phosphatase family protein [Rikenellaceae bacterium]|nr:endonuclease/exonuclease/phosphatase family protein [Rikenellaceae bacterium]